VFSPQILISTDMRRFRPLEAVAPPFYRESGSMSAPDRARRT